MKVAPHLPSVDKLTLKFQKPITIWHQKRFSYLARDL